MRPSLGRAACPSVREKNATLRHWRRFLPLDCRCLATTVPTCPPSPLRPSLGRRAACPSVREKNATPHHWRRFLLLDCRCLATTVPTCPPSPRPSLGRSACPPVTRTHHTMPRHRFRAPTVTLAADELGVAGILATRRLAPHSCCRLGVDDVMATRRLAPHSCCGLRLSVAADVSARCRCRLTPLLPQ
jgi:hypothetical protein